MRHHSNDRVMGECVDLRSCNEKELVGFVFGGRGRIDFTLDGKSVYSMRRGSLSTNCGGRRLTITTASSPFRCDYTLVEPAHSNWRQPHFTEGVTHVMATVPTPELVSALRIGMDQWVADEEDTSWKRDLTLAQGVSEYSRLGNYWYSYHMNVHSFNAERWHSTLEGPEPDEPYECPDCGSEEICEGDWGSWYCEHCEFGWDPHDYDDQRLNDDEESCWATGILDTEREQYTDELFDYIAEDLGAYAQAPRHLRCQMFCDSAEGQRYAMGVVPAVVAHVRVWNSEKEDPELRAVKMALTQFARSVEPRDWLAQHVEASVCDTLRRTGAFSISTNVANPGCTYTLAYIAWLWEHRRWLSDMLGVKVLMPQRMASNPNEASHSLDSAIVYVHNVGQFVHQVRYDNPSSYRTVSFAKDSYFPMDLDERGVFDV